LPNTWTRLRFAVSALRPGPGSLPERDGLRWEDCRTGVRELILGTWANPGDTVRFELAEIRLLGLTSRSYAP
jgi:hypothetical protein